MPDADPLAPVLTAIRDDIAARDELSGSTDWDVPDDAGRFNAAQDKVAARAPSLLAAVEAALAHHSEAVIEDARPPFHYCWTCSGHPRWPCPEVRDITAALTGKESGGEH